MSDDVERAQNKVARITDELMTAIGQAAEAKFAADAARERHDQNMFSYASAHRNAENRVTEIALQAVHAMCEAFVAASRDAAIQRHPSSPKVDETPPATC